MTCYNHILPRNRVQDVGNGGGVAADASQSPESVVVCNHYPIDGLLHLNQCLIRSNRYSYNTLVRQKN